jgi:Flp pilus assembly protein TadD
MRRKYFGRSIFSHRRAILPWPRAAGALCTAILPAAVCLGGCQSNSGPQDVTASIGTASQSSGAESAGEKQRAVEAWGRQYDRHPDDKATALNYATALRGMTEYAQAAAVLQRRAIKFPRDTEVLGAYGKALADSGRLRLKIAPAQPYVLSNLGLSYALSMQEAAARQGADSRVRQNLSMVLAL